MAVVKMKYTWSRDAIKAHLRYIVHRPGKEWEKATRELFQHNYMSVTKQDVYDSINSAPKNTLFYKMMINFHPTKEDTHKDLDLHYIASLTVREMQYRIGRDVPFFATIHNGHAKTDLRHIHAICLVQGRLSKTEYARLQTLWQVATAEVKEQRRSRDRVQERQRTQFLTQARVLYQYQSAPGRYLSQVDAPKKRYRGVKPLQLQPGCYSCGYGQLSGLPSWYDFCPCCHKPLTQEKTLQLELSRQGNIPCFLGGVYPEWPWSRCR
jgi:hypothetical protein